MFGEILRSLREGRHLKQKELAEKLYISPSAISQYENGRTRPSRENLEALTKFFNVSTDYLLRYSSNADLEEMMNQPHFGNVSVSEFLEKCMLLPQEHRATLMDIIDGLVLLGRERQNEVPAVSWLNIKISAYDIIHKLCACNLCRHTIFVFIVAYCSLIPF